MDVEYHRREDKNNIKGIVATLYGHSFEKANDHIWILYIDPNTVTPEDVVGYAEEIIQIIKPCNLIILPNTSYLKGISKEEVENWIAYAQSVLKTI